MRSATTNAQSRPSGDLRLTSRTPARLSTREAMSKQRLDQRGYWDETLSMSNQEIDAYLVRLDEPQRSTLRELRQSIMEIVPEAEQGIAYGIPAFRLQGKVVAGFAAFKQHCSYFPHSESVLTALSDDVEAYVISKGTLRFPLDAPLPKSLVKKLLTLRIDEEFKNGVPGR